MEKFEVFLRLGSIERINKVKQNWYEDLEENYKPDSSLTMKENLAELRKIIRGARVEPSTPEVEETLKNLGTTLDEMLRKQ